MGLTFSSEPFDLDWKQREFLGAGSYGYVYKCPVVTGDKTPSIIAVKVPKSRKRENDLEKLKEETNLLSTLSHKNIIQVYGICEITQDD